MLGRHYEVEPSYATEANVVENTNKEQQICRDQTPLGATRARVTGLSRGPAVRRTSRDKLTMRSTQLAFGSTHPGLIAGGRYCRPGPKELVDAGVKKVRRIPHSTPEDAQ